VAATFSSKCATDEVPGVGNIAVECPRSQASVICMRVAQIETDEQVRMDNATEAERLLVQDDAAIAPMWFQGVAALIRPSIKNFGAHPTGTHEFKWVMSLTSPSFGHPRPAVSPPSRY